MTMTGKLKQEIKKKNAKKKTEELLTLWSMNFKWNTNIEVPSQKINE